MTKETLDLKKEGNDGAKKKEEFESTGKRIAKKRLLHKGGSPPTVLTPGEGVGSVSRLVRKPREDQDQKGNEERRRTMNVRMKPSE